MKTTIETTERQIELLTRKLKEKIDMQDLLRVQINSMDSDIYKVKNIPFTQLMEKCEAVRAKRRELRSVEKSIIKLETKISEWQTRNLNKTISWQRKLERLQQ